MPFIMHLLTRGGFILNGLRTSIDNALKSSLLENYENQ